MKDLLRKLKLINFLTIELQLNKTEFIERLSAITDEGETGIFSDMFDLFSSSKNEFKGQVNDDGFKLKRRRRFFDSKMNRAVATGMFYENNGKLTVETEIYGFKNFFIVFYVFLILFYSVFIFSMSNLGNNFRILCTTIFAPAWHFNVINSLLYDKTKCKETEV